MKSFVPLTFLLALLCGCFFPEIKTEDVVPIFSGNVYQRLNADEKLDLVWKYISRDNTPLDYYSKVYMLQLFLENMNVTFNNVGEVLPWQGPGGLIRRMKLLHTVGCVAPIRFRSTGNHNYTGIFTGAQSGLIRFSWANPPHDGPTPYSPAFALKFFRNGMRSANVMTLVSLLGVNTSNYFAYDMTNHVPNINPKEVIQQKVKSLFESASRWPTQIGISEMARFNQYGVEEKQPKFPFRLIFHPSPMVRNIMDNDKVTNFPKHFLRYIYKPITGLYSVYAEDYPPSQSGKRAPPVKIGEIDMLSPPVTSLFGDQDLFFQHVKMDDDYELRPDWLADAWREFNWQFDQSYYIYPPIPDK